MQRRIVPIEGLGASAGGLEAFTQLLEALPCDVTINDELSNRNAELNQVNNDLVNLLGSVQAAIVMLGQDLRVRRFTPMAENLLKLELRRRGAAAEQYQA